MGIRCGKVGLARLQLTGDGHDGERAVVGHTGTAEPVGTAESVQKAVLIEISGYTFGFGGLRLGCPLRHAKGNAYGGYGVGALFGVLAVLCGRGSGAAGGAHKRVYIVQQPLSGLRREVVAGRTKEEAV